jgi:hypothetical protein
MIFYKKITKKYCAVCLQPIANGVRIYLLPIAQNYFTHQLEFNKNYNLSFSFYTEEGSTYVYESHDFDTF